MIPYYQYMAANMGGQSGVRVVIRAGVLDRLPLAPGSSGVRETLTPSKLRRGSDQHGNMINICKNWAVTMANPAKPLKW